MKTTPADLPDSIEDLRALVLLQAEKHAEEKQQLERKVYAQERAIADHEQVIADHEQAIAKQEQTVSEYSEEITQLREYIRLLKSQRFGPKSERSPSSQLGLFNEAEVLWMKSPARYPIPRVATTSRTSKYPPTRDASEVEGGRCPHSCPEKRLSMMCPRSSESAEAIRGTG